MAASFDVTGEGDQPTDVVVKSCVALMRSVDVRVGGVDSVLSELAG